MHTSPNDLLSITTFDNTKKDFMVHEKSEQYNPEKMIDDAEDNEKQKTLKDKTEDNNSIHDNETNKADNIRQTLGKRKLASQKSCIIDENNIKVKKRKISADQNIAGQQNENCNMENQESASFNENINRNKIAESDGKKKKKLMINDTFPVENVSEEVVRRDSHELLTKLDKNKEIGTGSRNKHDNVDIEKREIVVDERKKKKNRKKKNKVQEDITYNIGLQVMAKQDWKYLRNKYLELQKSKMRQLKLHLKKARWNYDKVGQNYDKFKYEKDNSKSSEAEKSCYGHVIYAPGIIVKIEMDEPCTDPQNLKVHHITQKKSFKI